jgi:hypothetical protein
MQGKKLELPSADKLDFKKLDFKPPPRLEVGAGAAACLLLSLLLGSPGCSTALAFRQLGDTLAWGTLCMCWHCCGNAPFPETVFPRGPNSQNECVVLPTIAGAGQVGASA